MARKPFFSCMRIILMQTSLSIATINSNMSKAHENLVRIAFAQMPLINDHAAVSGKVKGLHRSRLYPQPYFESPCL